MSDLLELEKKPDVWVGNEWGELKEVVIGRPDQHQFPTLNDMLKERLNGPTKIIFRPSPEYKSHIIEVH